MAKIPVYESITVGRQTPNLYDPNAVAQAGSGMRAMAGVAEEVKVWADKQAEAQAVTETNLAVIESKKKKIELQQQMQQENMANPQGFTKLFEEQLKKVDEEFSSGLSSRAKSAYLETARNNNLSFYDNNLTWENNRQTSMHAERIESAAETLGTMAFRAGTEGRGIDDLKKDADATLVAASTFVAPEKLSDIKRKIYGNITETWISGVAENNPSKAKRLLETRKYDEDLGGDGLKKVYGIIEQKQNKIEAEAKEAKLQESADLDIAIDLAESPEELNQLKERVESLKGGISPSSYAQKIIRSNHKLKKILEENETRAYVADALEGRIPLDLSNSDVKKAVGKHYLATTEKLKDLPAGKQAESRAFFATQIGAVPDEMKREMSSLLRSKNDEEVILAANTINLVRMKSPEVVSDFTDDTIRQANAVLANISYGYAPKEAIERTREVQKVDPTVKNVRQDEYRNLVKDKGSDKYLSKQLDEWFSSDPEINSIMSEEFTKAAEQEYILNGDFDSARKTALDLTLRSWGKSEVTGEKKWVKNPPEKFYALTNLSKEENAEWMRGQLEKDLEPTGIDLESVTLVPDGKEKPSYIVMHKNDEDILNVLLDANGRPMLWRPDRKFVVEKARAERANR